MTRTGRFAVVALVAASLAACQTTETQIAETGFLDRNVVLDGAEYGYQVYVPRQYDPSTAWPVILFLHGGGEGGTDGLIQTEVGLGGAIRRNVERFPAVTVFPQAPPEGTCQGLAADIAMAALDDAMAEFSTDSSRVYLTGLSMGGNGSWYLSVREPDRFAAMVVVCGFITGRDSPRGSRYASIAPDSAEDPFAAVAQQIADLPVWIFHGDADTVVPVEESRGMAAALDAIGADVQYTELPGVGHNAWDPAYRSEDLAAWLFEQRRP